MYLFVNTITFNRKKNLLGKIKSEYLNFLGKIKLLITDWKNWSQSKRSLNFSSTYVRT